MRSLWICIIWAVTLFLGGFLVYLVVNQLIIRFNRRLPLIISVEEGKKRKEGENDRRSDPSCFFFNVPSLLFLSYLSHLLASPVSSFFLTSFSQWSAFLTHSKISFKLALMAARSKQTKNWLGDGVNKLGRE